MKILRPLGVALTVAGLLAAGLPRTAGAAALNYDVESEVGYCAVIFCTPTSMNGTAFQGTFLANTRFGARGSTFVPNDVTIRCDRWYTVGDTRRHEWIIDHAVPSEGNGSISGFVTAGFDPTETNRFAKVTAYLNNVRDAVHHTLGYVSGSQWENNAADAIAQGNLNLHVSGMMYEEHLSGGVWVPETPTTGVLSCLTIPFTGSLGEVELESSIG